MKRIGAIVCVLFAIFILGALSCGRNEESSLSVRIVPTSASPKIGKWIGLWLPANQFYVVITNVSKQRQSVWKEWCSWGWYSLSFTFSPGFKEMITIKRNINEWQKNFPDYFMLNPGDHYVLAVNLFDGSWLVDGEQLDSAKWPDKGTLTAIYTILPDEETRDHGVWTGKISSEPQLFVFDISDELTKRVQQSAGRDSRDWRP